MTTELLKQALSAMRDVADLMEDRWPMDTQQRAPKFFQAMRDIDAALSKPASEDAWLRKSLRLTANIRDATDDESSAAYFDQLEHHLRARPAREGFVSVPVEPLRELIADYVKHTSSEYLQAPPWLSRVRESMIEAAKGDGK